MKGFNIVFSGKVQRVGFRNTTQKIASGLGLVGWVRNLRDGRVEMLVSGNEEKINHLLEELSGRFVIHSREMNETEEIIEVNEFTIIY